MSAVAPSPAQATAQEAAWSDELRTHGRRVTKQRLAVLHAVEEQPHATAEMVADTARQALPNLSVQSVYAVLADLTSIQMLRKFEPPASAAMYETRTQDNHHHAYCVSCGTVEDVDCVVGHAPCLTPGEDHGMVLLSAEVLFRGVCRSCRSAEEPAPPL